MPRPPAQPYHHGDLERALLDAARALLVERGIDALSLREVARAAGVSAAAPYRHFPNKGALLAALAAASFNALNDAFIAALAGYDDRPYEGLMRMGEAYIAYARSRPHEYQLMFRMRHHGVGEHPALDEAATRTFTSLVQAYGRQHAALGRPPETLMGGAVATWAMVHGMSMLYIDQQIGFIDPAQVPDVAGLFALVPRA